MSQVLTHGIFAAASVALFLAADRGAEMVTYKDEPRVLTLAQFYFTPASDGRAATFTQQVVSESGKAVTAVWAAEINRVVDGITYQLCAGGGEAPYLGTEDTYEVDDWVGDDCPELLPGDRAEATWEYRNHHNLVTSLSATFTIPEVPE